MRKVAVIVLLLSVVLVSGMISHSAAAAALETQKVKVGISAMITAFLPIYVAKEKGFFEKEGLDASLVFFKSGTENSQALISGDVKFGAGGLTEPILLKDEADVDTRVVAAALNAMVYKLYALPDIKSPKDLNGKTLGVSKYGALSDFVIQELIRKLQLKDIKVLQIGSHAARLAAMDTKQIHGTILDAPLTAVAESKGYNMVVDVGKTIPDFVKEVIYAREDFVTKNPETTKAFLRAYVKAMKFVKENKAEAVAINAKTLNFPVKDSELGYDEMFPAWPANSMPSLVGFTPLVTMMFEAKQIKKKYTPEELSNLKALKEVLTELKIKY